MIGRGKLARLTAQEIAQRVEYRDGQFYWLPRADETFSRKVWADRWNDRFAYKPLTYKAHSKGYHQIRIDGFIYQAHRVIWALQFGEWPTGELDHINGDVTDNRIENLRDVTKSINMRNQKLRKDNTSGMPGVCWSVERGMWRVNVATPDRRHYVGQFERLEDAIAARKAAQLRHGFTGRHGCAA